MVKRMKAHMDSYRQTYKCHSNMIADDKVCMLYVVAVIGLDLGHAVSFEVVLYGTLIDLHY